MLIKLDTIVLKVTSRCNLNCTYCYEYNRGDTSWKDKPKYFNLESAAALTERISEYSRAVKLERFSINIHGGEPTLAGADYLEDLFATLSSQSSIPLKYGLQTNGTLLHDSLLKVLQRHQVKVAVSIDGTEHANRHRIDHAGRPTFSRALAGIDQLRQYGCFSGIQTVIDLSEHPEAVLLRLAECAPPEIELGQPFGNYDNPPAIDRDGCSLGQWLLRAFHVWVGRSDLARIRVTILGDALRAVLSDDPRTEWFPNRPPGYLVVATDGTIEGLDILKINGHEGRILNMNIKDHSLEQATQHSYIQQRAYQTIQRPRACWGCGIIDWCNGGYYPTRYSRINGFANRSIYCADWITLFRGIASWAIQQEGVPAERKRRIAEKIEQLSRDRVGQCSTLS